MRKKAIRICTLMLLLMRGLAVEDAIGLYRRAPLPLD